MNKKTLREQRKARRRRQQLRARIGWGLAGIVVLGIVAFLVWNSVRSLAGEAIPLLPNSQQHIQVGTVVEYNSDPPTSGPHYGTSLNAGFYPALSDLPENADGYLIHNLEHGYVIFWYNCQVLPETECETLQSQIRGVMDSFNSTKLIAVPRPSLDVPLVMTSWGRLERFESFDEARARVFVQNNRNQAPEPTAP